MKNYKMKLRGLNKVKNKKIILIASSLLAIGILAGCGNTTTQESTTSTTNTKTEKLAFTLANVQESFKGQYYVENVSVDESGTNETFVTKTNVNEKEAAKLLNDIQAKIKETFILKVPNSITLLNDDYKILGSNNNYPEDGEDN